VGKDVVISVIAVRGNSVKIGIDAPERMTILRRELQQSAETSSFDAVPALIVDSH
jgi:carbon storage regulator CsrA